MCDEERCVAGLDVLHWALVGECPLVSYWGVEFRVLSLWPRSFAPCHHPSSIAHRSLACLNLTLPLVSVVYIRHACHYLYALYFVVLFYSSFFSGGFVCVEFVSGVHWLLL